MSILQGLVELFLIAAGIIILLNTICMVIYFVYLTIMLIINSVRFIIGKPFFEIDEFVGV